MAGGLEYMSGQQLISAYNIVTSAIQLLGSTTGLTVLATTAAAVTTGAYVLMLATGQTDIPDGADNRHGVL